MKTAAGCTAGTSAGALADAALSGVVWQLAHMLPATALGTAQPPPLRLFDVGLERGADQRAQLRSASCGEWSGAGPRGDACLDALLELVAARLLCVLERRARDPPAEGSRVGAVVATLRAALRVRELRVVALALKVRDCWACGADAVRLHLELGARVRVEHEPGARTPGEWEFALPPVVLPVVLRRARTDDGGLQVLLLPAASEMHFAPPVGGGATRGRLLGMASTLALALLSRWLRPVVQLMRVGPW